MSLPECLNTYEPVVYLSLSLKVLEDWSSRHANKPAAILAKFYNFFKFRVDQLFQRRCNRNPQTVKSYTFSRATRISRAYTGNLVR